MSRKLSFNEACRRYVHRYTMEHVPVWAQTPLSPGKYYAPQYRTDRDWYDNAIFPREPGYYGSNGDCCSSGQTWPLGQWLDKPFTKGTDA